MYTLFQVMTLESWSMGIVRPILALHPYAWIFFVPFILVTTFTVLNRTDIIVDAMASVKEDENAEKFGNKREQTAVTNIESIMDDIGEIKAALKRLEER